MAKTVYSIKTLDGNPVRAEEAWKDSDGGLLNKKVTTDTDQTIDGVKTFSTYAKIDEIDNTSGNALVRHKATEGKNVFGGVNHDAVIMGKSDRPFYSKDGADFIGNALALASDVITFVPQNYNYSGFSSFDDAPDNTRYILSNLTDYCPVFIGNSGDAISTHSYIHTFKINDTSKLQILYLQEARYNNACYYIRSSWSNGTEVVWAAWQLVGHPHFVATAYSAEDLAALVPQYVKFNGSTIKLAWDITYDFSNGINGEYNDIQLGNDITIEGGRNSKIYCNYTGGVSTVENNYSIFHKKVGAGGFTLRGLNFECYNIRYCVHDEDDGADEIYHNNYINCDMYKNDLGKSSGNAERMWYCQCIGGGLGKSGDILIEGCKLISKNDLESADPSEVTEVSYHNYGGTSNNAKGSSHITMVGNYFEHTARVTYYGSQTAVSTALISNNSCGSRLPFIRAETNTGTIVNMELLSWNNFLRS